ncbi:MAG: FtsX-like permease family protein [Aestuariivirga sp.]|nr:FtsX-like permease family protein [Aestuariivirga sp.]MCA3562277.1 FtsX-like permease family protein [Aestuariivirga sp.]
MRVLDIKLLRDLRRLWPQALAIALVMAAGVATLILGAGAHDSLATTRERYYEANRFADVFAGLTRAPKALQPEIAAIDGVAAAETRIEKIALADLPGMAEPASVLLVSVPDHGEQVLNRVYLRSGRMPSADSGGEALASAGFARAHGLREGSTIRVLINGRQRELRISGTALSPEFVYALGPGALMPDERRYGILYLPEREMSAAYDLEGAFNSVSLRLVRGSNPDKVIAALDRLLDRYGGLGAYPRKDQTSHAFLDAELQQLRAMSRILPPIFLVVSAFLVNMTLTRLIALERERIGLLKAMGYSSLAVVRHYAGFVTLIAVLGIAIGVVAGTWLGAGMTTLYAQFFSFPFLVFSRNPAVYGIAAGATYAAALLGAVKAVREVAWLSPAVAMSPPAPQRYRKVLGGRVELSRYVRQSSVIVIRHLTHWPLRTLSGIFGMALAVAILVGSLWTFGSINLMIDATFRLSDRQDAAITFTSLRPMSALYEARRLPAVMEAEPFRALPVKLRHGPAERRVSLVGKSREASLSRVLDGSLKPVVLPSEGLVISDALARLLRAGIGDEIEVEILEGRRQTVMQPVSAIITGFIGLTAYMNLDAMNRMLMEGAAISGVYLGLDMEARDQLFSVLKETPAASFIALQYAALEKFRETLAQNVTIMISVYAAFAGIIAFGVVYNFARISLSEQGREMASLRVLGFTKAEVSGLLMGELAVVAILAQPLGWLLGYSFALMMAEGFRTELYRVPLVVNREVFAWASLVVFAAAAVSGLVVRRRIDRLDMIEVLKTRE